MKPRQPHVEKGKRVESPPRKNVNTDSKLDELGIQRGQNAEKGNTINPRHVRDAKEASH